MRVVIVGLGIQGRKRLAAAGADAVATVDPAVPDAACRELAAVPPASYDAALVCTPDAAKLDLLAYLVAHGKHALVEKPLPAGDGPAGERERVAALAAAAARRGVVVQTAYNHRFEPHFARMKAVIDAGTLGALYACRLFYGNGTARDVRASPWRDRGAGVLPDLGSHLLDTVLWWFGPDQPAFRIFRADRFENRACDRVMAGHAGPRSVGAPAVPRVDLEMSLLSWRNTFACDLIGAAGSAHIDSLCKWGPSTFTLRRRRLPSGRPDEEAVTLVQPDPTWALEYADFKQRCATGGGGNLANDLWIGERLAALAAEALNGEALQGDDLKGDGP